MENKPVVSVLMTAYNREKYISEAIESILASTYHNWELIIVDDKSKDKTVDIAKAYEAKDERIKVYTNEINLGDYPNRNMAASYARGKYLKYVDADDKLYSHGLQVLVNMMENFPEAGYGLCSIPQDKERIFPYILSPQETYYHNYVRKKGMFVLGPLSSIIKREAFDKVGGFVNLRMVGDYEMWHKLSLQFSVVLMPQGLTWYRRHSEQEMNSHYKFLMEYLKLAEHYVTQCELEECSKEKVLNQLRRHQLIKLLKNPMKQPLQERLKFFKNSNIRLSKILKDSSIFDKK